MSEGVIGMNIPLFGHEMQTKLWAFNRIAREMFFQRIYSVKRTHRFSTNKHSLLT